MSLAEPAGPDDLELAAAEYVLGTLDVAERATFARRLRSDEAARMAVARWERRFAGLSDTIVPVAPPHEVWTALERALRAEGFGVIDGGRGSAPAPRVLPNLRRSRDRWRAGAIAASLVAAALAGVVVTTQLRRPSSGRGDVYVAAVNRGGEKPALIVEVDLAKRSVRVRPVAAETPAGKSLELWYIDPGAKPRSMGVVDATTQTISIPAGAKDGAATIAVTVEPPGGSKTGDPTGPVVYAGQLVKE